MASAISTEGGGISIGSGEPVVERKKFVFKKKAVAEDMEPKPVIDTKKKFVFKKKEPVAEDMGPQPIVDTKKKFVFKKKEPVAEPVPDESEDPLMARARAHIKAENKKEIERRTIRNTGKIPTKLKDGWKVYNRDELYDAFIKMGIPERKANINADKFRYSIDSGGLILYKTPKSIMIKKGKSDFDEEMDRLEKNLSNDIKAALGY